MQLTSFKFRGLDGGGVWHYGFLTIIPQQGVYINSVSVIPFTVGMYVGDKDGSLNEIYEGDIICSVLDGKVYKIQFPHGNISKGCAPLQTRQGKEFKIIGNIYQNN